MIKLKDILESVGIDDGEVKFDLMNDHPNDPLKTFINSKQNRFEPVSAFRLTNVYYAYRFTPYTQQVKMYGDKNALTRDEWNDKINAIRTDIKAYKNPNTVTNVNTMIDTSLLRFERVAKLSSFDTIIPLKSSSVLNDVIAEKISKKTNAKVLSDIIVKNTLKNVKLSIPSSETSDKTKEYLATIDKRFAKMSDEEFKSKMIKASFRRYVSNFLKYKNDPNLVKEYIAGKNILIIDDTLGEGATLAELRRLIMEYNPKSITFYVFLKDY